MNKEISKVLSFQKATDAPTPTAPTLLPQERAILRLKLQTEELNEMREAMANNDLVEIADALADQMYLLFGTAIEYGLADRMEMIFHEVHVSNMSKMVNGKPVFREDGKVTKPEGYKPPNIKSIVERDHVKFSDIDESLDAASKSIYEAFDKKINDYIKKNLKPSDQEKFKLYTKLENELSKKVDVKLGDVSGVTVADITLYGGKTFQIWEL